MAIHDLLQYHYHTLSELYKENSDNVRTLQRMLIQDILPGLVDELELDGESKERTRRWLEDHSSIFRILKRHKFTVSFALGHIREVISWRLMIIPPRISTPSSAFLRCLPANARDPFGRPILVLKLAHILGSTTDSKNVFIHYMELLRLHLEQLNSIRKDEGMTTQPVLQYVVLLDIQGISMQCVQNVDTVSWYVHELLPRFPGMLAAVFILNYSWAHSGIWNIVKRALPTSALSRVFFPSTEELLEFFSPSSLPHEYGGHLPPLSQLADPLDVHMAPPANSAESSKAAITSSPNSHPFAAAPSALSPTSSLNPYYGYPISCHPAAPMLRYGRRRKRDLLRTLARLWWARWKDHILAGVCLLLTLLLLSRSSLLQRWRYRRLDSSVSIVRSPIGRLPW